MRATELRRAYTEFFQARDHTLVPSSGLIPTHPTAPMFTNSGMMQFVPYFLGEESRPSTRRGPCRSRSACAPAASTTTSTPSAGPAGTSASSRCSATSASATTSRPTPSPGPGSSSPRCSASTATASGSRSHVRRRGRGHLGRPGRVPRERIQRLDKDNFWEMGDTGPCGPARSCSGTSGPEWGPDGGPANPAAEERYVEFWNLVFPQYFRQPDGSLTDLDAPGIDTGAGPRAHPRRARGLALALRRRHALGAHRPRPSRSPAPARRLRSPRRHRPALLADHTRTMRSSSPTASCPPTRTAATCCAASSAAPCTSPTCSASRSRCCPRWSRPASS
jgi:hypothetical protein